MFGCLKIKGTSSRLIVSAFVSHELRQLCPSRLSLRHDEGSSQWVFTLSLAQLLALVFIGCIVVIQTGSRRDFSLMKLDATSCSVDRA